MNGQCESIERLIIDYALGELDPSECACVEEHLRSCAGCQEALVEVQQIASALSEQEMVEPRAALCESVRTAVGQKAYVRRGAASGLAGLAASLVRRPLLAGASALLMIAVVTLLFVVPWLRPTRESSSGKISAQRVEVSATVLREFVGYLTESAALVKMTRRAETWDIFAGYGRDYWMGLIGQAMYMREYKGLEAYYPLLRDLEEFYHEIMDCQGRFTPEQIRGIRQQVYEKKLLERMEEAIDGR